MKKVKYLIALMIVGAFIIPTAAEAKSSKYVNSNHGPTHKVGGYTKKNGTHVDSYQRTRPNHTKKDNLRYH